MNLEIYPTVEIITFEKETGLPLIVKERDYSHQGNDRYYCNFDKMAVVEGIAQCYASGNGATPNEAITAYCRRISRHDLVGNGREITEEDRTAGRVRTWKYEDGKAGEDLIFHVPNLVYHKKYPEAIE